MAQEQVQIQEQKQQQVQRLSHAINRIRGKH